ncbi:hypothetical protein EHS25_005349 [Saitozyma podzolica]|uniref:Uncharacterized protein n=1 Tax=Saitozyma podzolica TaxID=1890683 RepID=A0A427XYY9_9TREE|nr:hypothetical protein EHS25_005349 [Saitozyma podzolica]
MSVEGVDVRELVKLYFSTVHHFGYLSFIHEADYWERFEQGRVPEGLTLLMAASALRFGGRDYGPEMLEVADRWVARTGEGLIPLILDEFGAVELMTYDFLNGRYSRGFVMAGMAVSSDLGLSAHLIRSITARQAIADVHSRISRRLIESDQIPEAVETAESHARRLLDTFPAAMTYSRAQYHAFRDQVPIMVHLHLMRQTVQRHISLLRILSAADLHSGTPVVSRHRASLVQSAKETSRVVFDALEHRVTLDPQNAMHAYNAIEILLFQPIRQSAERAQGIITREEVAIALKPLLQVIRNLAKVCELVALLLGYVDDLTEEDMVAVLKKVHSLANVDAEFDFNNSFWRYELSISRQSPNDALLELPSTSPAILPSQTVDATDSIAHLQNLFSGAQPLGGITRSGMTDATLAIELSPFDNLPSIFNSQPSAANSVFPFAWTSFWEAAEQ